MLMTQILVIALVINMTLSPDDLATIIDYTAADMRRRNLGAAIILPLAKLRNLHMEKSITIATQELARIQIDSLYWK